jgi:CRISPR/Cas system-associated endonuclease Cas1
MHTVGRVEYARLDPVPGFLHQVDYGCPSLALDLTAAFLAGASQLAPTLASKCVPEPAGVMRSP